jgi:hypothetical protein
LLHFLLLSRNHTRHKDGNPDQKTTHDQEQYAMHDEQYSYHANLNENGSANSRFKARNTSGVTGLTNTVCCVRVVDDAIPSPINANEKSK